MQPDPKKTDEAPVFEQVTEDLRQRAEGGKAEYGTYLQPGNGRDHLQDAYEEVLDLACYLKAYQERDKTVVAFLRREAQLQQDHMILCYGQGHDRAAEYARGAREALVRVANVIEDGSIYALAQKVD